jgi:carboxylesterase type B
VGGLGPIEDPELSRIMLTYWTNFSKIGNPNGEDIPDWDTMKSKQDTWHLLGPKIGQENISRMDIYNLLRRIS